MLFLYGSKLVKSNRFIGMQKAIKIFMLPVLVALFSFVCYGQVITTENLGRYKAWPRYTEILKFYQLTNFQPAWIGKTGL